MKKETDLSMRKQSGKQSERNGDMSAATSHSQPLSSHENKGPQSTATPAEPNKEAQELIPDRPPEPVPESQAGADAPAKPRRPRGFAAMDRNLVSEIARRGGKAAHSAGTAHEFTTEEARVAGRKGGRATHAKRRAQSGPETPQAPEDARTEPIDRGDNE